MADDPPAAVSFGDRLRAARAQQGLSLSDLAVRSGVSRAAISRAERAEASPSLDNAVQLARALGVRLSDLVADGATPGPQVARSGEGSVLRSPSGAVRRSLVADEGVEVVLYELPAGTRAGPFPARVPALLDLFHVLEGTVALAMGGWTQDLAAGDTALVRVTREFSIANDGPGPARCLLGLIPVR